MGISLEAFRAFPEGFPTYRFKDKISDTVNKFLRENGLLETQRHTLYGLRHSFEDRMLKAGIDERVRRDPASELLAAIAPLIVLVRSRSNGSGGESQRSWSAAL
ncbi:hypothetical protein N7E70_017465 [Aminobacter sp. NyZ550]|uniref:hypothetical protein n=1 Tax=Aminobacter sp. NyZ550 TaxID=2979870 RepID=UPI0021D56D9F|nr:hypothetical protein [Aminobacter sp. NyZ550]WAX93470.1 hypothetical protein N7E70_017465 [Aminobacter sp. NyZ550]